VLISSAVPLVNIPDYPELQGLLAAIRRLPRHRLVDAVALAGDSARAANMVLVGAATPYLPVGRELLESSIRELFAGKGEGVVAANLKAFAAGLAAG
jgi:indolepyruvate ferredoxin oxidoreductase beta subunit